jgi:hypothetical protein
MDPGQDSPSKEQIELFLSKGLAFRVRCRDLEERNKREKPEIQKSLIR